MAVTTTIRVRRETRDRLAAAARRTGQSADSVIGSALDEYERRLFWSAWDDAHNGATEAEAAEAERETQMFDQAASADHRAAGRAEDSARSTA
jgi:predicted transcriptional regulator